MRASSETHSWAAVPEHYKHVSRSVKKLMVYMQAYPEMVTGSAYFASYCPFRQCDPDCRLCIEGGVTWRGSFILSPHFVFSLPYTRFDHAMHKPSRRSTSLKLQLLRKSSKMNVLFSRSISGALGLTRLS